MVIEQPGRRQTVMTNWIMFGSGLLCAFLSTNSLFGILGPDNTSDAAFPTWSAWLPFSVPLSLFLLLPLAAGLAIPPTVNWGRQHLISTALGRGWLLWGGMSSYWLPLALYANRGWTQEGVTRCLQANYHGFCGLYPGILGLFLYLLYGATLFPLGVICSALTLQFFRRYLPL